MYAAPPFSFCVRRIAARAASAVTGRPVWKVAPDRSVNVHVLPPPDETQWVARSGLTVLVFES